MILRTNPHTILVVPDLQEPFAHPDAYRFVSILAEKVQPTHVVFAGDEVDFHALSRFPHNPDGFSPGHELEAARKALQKWYKLFEGFRVNVCHSNHLGRIFKRAYHAGIPVEFLANVRDFLGAPANFHWAVHHEIAGIRFEHGDASNALQAARNLAIANRQSTVIGHHHAHASIHYINSNHESIFGMNVGCLINRHAYPFEYGTTLACKPTLGAGLVVHGVPSWVPMPLNARERLKLPKQ